MVCRKEGDEEGVEGTSTWQPLWMVPRSLTLLLQAGEVNEVLPATAVCGPGSHEGDLRQWGGRFMVLC